MTELKAQIQSALNQFANGTLLENAKSLLNILGYESDRTLQLSPNNYKGFAEQFIQGISTFDPKKAKKDDWDTVDIIFQITQDDIRKTQSLFQAKQVDNKIIESYLFFAISLKGDTYNRSDLVKITREINKLTSMPSMILFRYNDYLTIAVIDRRLHKREASKDVLEKVTLIKDINIIKPHRAHIEILFDLASEELLRKHRYTNFVELHNAWKKTLDTKELNKRFFQELANWYFWAVQNVEFPDDAEKKRDVRNATNVIRLITRLMFVWFLKEKELVSEELFDEKRLKEILVQNSSIYYKAILQNLFFATLNTEMGKRRFRSKNDSGRDSHYFIHNVFRYEKEFVDPKETLERYFASIPFLNGGLFECLDKEVEEGGKLKRIRIDGFSDRDDNSLKVPDELFFGAEKETDLNDTYGTKNKHYKVRGLIDILSSYKFTIAENTPIEEEVALDPELLGKVFENLLANFNPETQTTARKQTGSFYTPREIVNYMVDESLIAYLSTVFASNETASGHGLTSSPRPITLSLSKGGEGNNETRLRHLLSYSEEPHRFSEEEVIKLISAIDYCKILDPAGGSGAFPMGMLHKLVHILSKLDPDNARWEQRQLDKVDKLIEDAESIPDANVREKVIEDLQRNRQDIEDSFANNELDYGRKLYLIENCIYGVDIQPIAVQIAKLRFFISLIVEQKTNPEKENLGIRPLPNLETKFVAANTLIGVDRPTQLMLRNPQIDKVEEELRQVREKHFAARTPATKEKYRKKDAELRQALTQLLEKDGWPVAEARKIASWDPYDQNSSSTWFDPEWMFGIKDGFDIVIGNPPYINISNLKPDEYRLELRNKFRSAKNKSDTYAFFLEQGFNLLKSEGTLSYIIPQTWKATDSFSKLREILFKEKSISKIVDLEFGTFDAIVKPMVVIISNKFGKYNSVEVFNDSFEKISDIKIADILKDSTLSINTTLNKEQRRVFQVIEKDSIPLEQIIQFSRGIKTSDDNRFIHTSAKNKDYKKVFRGKNIKSFQLNWNGEYIWYRPDLMKEKVGSVSYTKDFFEVPEKLVTQRVNSSMQLLCAYDNKQNYFLDTTNVSRYETWDKKISLKYLCAILNSKLINYWYCNKYLMPTIGIYEIHTIPVKKAKDQKPFITLVDQILAAKTTPPSAPLLSKEGNKGAVDTSALEKQIDEMVYKLYDLTPEEIGVVEGRE